jgi:hypothetical protein
MSWIDRAMHLFKFELHLQGSFQDDWQEIFKATGPSEDCDAKYFNKQVQNLLSNIFAKDEWSEMAGPLLCLNSLQQANFDDN